MGRNRCAKYLSAVCILTALLSGCSVSDSTNLSKTRSQDVIKETAGREVQTTLAAIMDISKVQLFPAQIAPKVTELCFPEAGIFSKYECSLGDRVKKGEILARTEETEQKKGIKDAQDVLAELKSDHEKATKHNQAVIDICELELKESALNELDALAKKQEIEKQKLLMRQETERYELEKDKQEKLLSGLEEELGKNVIVAPCDGTIVYIKSMDEGSNVTDTSTYIGVADETEYYLVSDYVERTFVDRSKRVYGIVDGKEYELTYQAPDPKITSKLSANNIDLHSTFAVNQPDESLHFSDYAEVVLVRDEAIGVLGIPKITVKSDTVGKYVYVQKDGEKSKVYIKTGVTDGVNVEVTDGLAQGDVIYVEN